MTHKKEPTMSILTTEQHDLVQDLVKRCPIERFGDGNPRISERQNIYGDVLDWIRDQIGYKDHYVAAIIMGEALIKKSARTI